MPTFWDEVFTGGFFMPHGHCYFWKPGLVWLEVISNTLIGLAYLGISATLALLVARIRDIPFKLMYLAFGIFIVTCGFTHFFDVLTVWRSFYWLDGGVRAVTAVASVATALALPPLIPRAVALARGAQAAHARGIRLETAVKDLGTLYERTRELEQSKTQFFANVSHELRTPLALILGPVEKLLSRPLGEQDRRDLEVVRRNARALLEQVNDLLDVARLEAGKLQPAWEKLDVATLVRGTAAQFEALARDRRIALTVNAPPELVAEVDAGQLQRIVLNLLSNAFKFTLDAGAVRVELGRAEGSFTLQVADSGPGVPEADRERIFERFQQLEGGSSPRWGGSGLGLAIVRDFVRLHGGEAGVDRAAEGGALFIVRLPLMAPAGAQVKGAQPRQAAESDAVAAAVAGLRPGAPSPALQGPAERSLVLVVEDNPELSRFLAETLARDYRVEVARDGVEGLEKARAIKPDLVLSDVMMPRLSGEELVRELRLVPELDGTPVVMLTAKADDELRVRLLRSGAQDYVMKPFSVEELSARVGNQIRLRRVRQVLQRELASRSADLEQLAREVTERRRELQGNVELLTMARDQAQRALRVRDHFLGLVSHELRTPITSLQLQIERLQRRGDGDAAGQREVLARMRVSVTRLTELVETLLEHARARAGQLVAVPLAVDARTVTREVAEELRLQAEQVGLALRCQVPEQPLPVRTDTRLLRLVLVNLVGNAIKFTRAGTVTLAAFVRGQQVCIAVSDTGPGIPRSEQARIFEEFVQLEPLDHKRAPGVGLGLALVREMTAAIGATVELESEVGKGSTFTVVLEREG